MIRAGGWICLAPVVAMSPAAPPAFGQNVQPISTSLAECAVIYTEIAGLRPARRRSPEKQELMYAGADLFAEEAVRQASAEGIADPEAHVRDLRADLATKWSGRMSSLLKLRENVDWIEYCAALGEDRGLLPLED